MDGESLKYKLSGILNENSLSDFMDERTSYDYIYEAVKEFVRRTKSLTGSQSISTVVNQTSYDLTSRFMHLYFRDSWNRLIIKYTSSGQDSWLTIRDYDMFVQNQRTGSVPNPDSFTLIDNQNQPTNVSGTATANGAASNGECTLTDATAPFSNIQYGDSVHNTTNGSSGTVIALTSTSAIVTCLFGGTSAEWALGDSYIVVPQPRKSLILDPPPSGANDTITVPYIELPIPVYSPYRSYRIDHQFEMALVSYAAWLYKYKDRQPVFGDALFKYWDAQCRRAVNETNKTFNRKSFRVNMTKTPSTYRDRSYR